MRYAVMYVFEASNEDSAREAADAAWYAMEDEGADVWEASARRLRSGDYSEPILDWTGWQDDAERTFHVFDS